MSIAEVKRKLDSLTAKLKEFESDAGRCTAQGCSFISDGLRLSQEVEVLRREIAGLREENTALKQQLAGVQSGAAATSGGSDCGADAVAPITSPSGPDSSHNQ
jgi:septal ring factor EnvC (AmiA/AmiB activator)